MKKPMRNKKRSILGVQKMFPNIYVYNEWISFYFDNEFNYAINNRPLINLLIELDMMEDIKRFLSGKWERFIDVITKRRRL